MKLSSFILSFAFIFILISCRGKDEVQTREKSLSRGFSLLDQERYDEAITYFSELNLKDPHPLVTLAWASAYAARAGIKIERIYAFTFVRDLGVPEANLKSHGEDNFHQNTSVLMRTLQGYEHRWQKIPTVSGRSVNDLSAAIEILRDVTIPGPSLYRATLRLVLLKSHVSEGLKGWQKVSFQKICSEDLRPYYEWGVGVLQDLVRLSQDLEYAYPEKKQNYENVRRHLEHFYQNVEGAVWPREPLCL